MATSQLPDRVACYRHADHLTGIHCTRCGRPICPDCMVVAPVGHHCPVCVTEGAQAVGANGQASPALPGWSLRERSADGALGGGSSAGGVSARGASAGGWLPRTRLGRTTPVVAALIAVNVVVFVLTSAHHAWEFDYAQIPALIAHGQWYRLLTATFVHENLTHLLFNMVALFIMGPPVEDALGRNRFLVLYLLSALGGSVCSFFFGPVLVAGIGASGAIFGIFGAWFSLARAQRSDTAAIVLLIAFLLAYSFYDTSIDWRAHVGGLVTGVVIGATFAWAARRRARARVAYEVAAAVAVLALLGAMVVFRSAQI